jgi:hypothetical protein
MSHPAKQAPNAQATRRAQRRQRINRALARLPHHRSPFLVKLLDGFYQ